MEIYTGDLIEIAKEYSEKISKELKRLGYTVDYVIEDECVNLQRDIRNVLHKRLSDAFDELIREEVIGDIEHAYLKADLRDKLFKIINEL